MTADKPFEPQVGILARLHIAPVRYEHHQGRVGTIQHVYPGFPSLCVLDIDGERLPNGTPGVVRLENIPATYLRSVEDEDASCLRGTPPKRKGRLVLKPTRDTRTEAERLAQGCELLEKEFGYRVFRVGQGRAAAICHACSREQKRMVRIKCRECGGDGYAPSTNSTAGVPDTFVLHETWKREGTVPGWLGIEWKDSPNGKRTDEQKQLESLGLLIVVWDTPSLVEAVVNYELRYLGMQPHPGLSAYLRERRSA